jgi:arginyl-tRNA synthetase
MSILVNIKKAAASAIEHLFQISVEQNQIQINLTKPEFEGDYTIVLFGLVKQLKQSPQQLGKALGDYLTLENNKLFTKYSLINGFLNLTINSKYWIDFLSNNYNNPNYGLSTTNHTKVMVEYSSPNTNKPLHLGHLRNNFLGWSIAEILKAKGNEVTKSCIVNDRGVHICKSMIAWQMFANGATPSSTNTKGDHFVGDYYVKFNDEYKAQVKELISQGLTEQEAEKQAPIMLATQQMLVDWEAGKPEIINLWKEMNSWVYEGFNETYKKIGSDFHKTYYESDTYLLGKNIVEQGLQKNVFYKKEDGSVWIDLTNEGLDEKLVMRKDGTSVYITQDIGLAEVKNNEFECEQSIYVIGDEQNYHMKVLKLICQKLNLPSANGIEHLSYGMVELPTGKMKSREGTVVDADDIVNEMISIAKQRTLELGKVNDFNEAELNELYETVGLGALKFFLLRVDPKKKMIFNPEESIDFHGFTGPFIQYTHARIKSILRKITSTEETNFNEELLPLEKSVLLLLEDFNAVIQNAATEFNPSAIAIYCFEVAKTFNSFYTEHSIANAETKEKQMLRLHICSLTAQVLKTGMSLLGIKVPERM